MKKAIIYTILLSLSLSVLFACAVAESDELSEVQPPAVEKKNIDILPDASTNLTDMEEVQLPAVDEKSIIAPPDEDSNLTENEIEAIMDYWSIQDTDEWLLTMPCYNGYGDTWSVYVGFAYETGLGIPYDYIGCRYEATEDIPAISFSTVEYWYYLGLTLIGLSGFYGDKPHEIGYKVTMYISTTQPDCETSRGISPGSTLKELEKAYPEIHKQEGYVAEYDPESGITDHDCCYVYAPDHTNRSIIFLLKNNVITQIDIADGFDRQLYTPRWLGTMD